MTETNQHKPRFVRKSGRTLLVQKLNENLDESIFENLEGLKSKHHTEKNNAYFLTFESLPHSLSSFRDFKKNEDVRVKFAHYKIFFTIEELNNNIEYTDIKTNHINLINDNYDGNVLYYKLYRKNDKYLDCGDLTLDTKESFDALIDSNNEDYELKVNGVNFTGKYYRYNRKPRDSENKMMSSNIQHE